MKTKAEIIDEILGIYIADPSRRAATSLGKCEYLTEDGRMCALGQCLDKDHPDYRTICRVNDIATGIPDLDGKLRPEYRGHEVGFWRDLQLMHDSAFYWDVDGLTEFGKSNMELLKRKWGHSEVGSHTDHEF